MLSLSRSMPIGPDDDGAMDYEHKKEIFHLAVRALADEFESDIRLKSTPRVLTIEGYLDKALGGDWREVLLGKMSDEGDGVGIEEALSIVEEDDDDKEDYFNKIMRRDLGNDYMCV